MNSLAAIAALVCRRRFLEDLALAPGEPEGIAPGARPGTDRDGPDAERRVAAAG
jgi:hypothetical protein